MGEAQSEQVGIRYVEIQSLISCQVHQILLNQWETLFKEMDSKPMPTMISNGDLIEDGHNCDEENFRNGQSNQYSGQGYYGDSPYKYNGYDYGTQRPSYQNQ